MGLNEHPKYANFGNFLCRKREAQDITLRELAAKLGVSAVYLSAVERGRKNPLSVELIDKAAYVLCLTDEEKTLWLDLAGDWRGSVAPDLPGYIQGRGYVAVALRTARDLGASEEEWMRFVDELRKREALCENG